MGSHAVVMNKTDSVALLPVSLKVTSCKHSARIASDRGHWPTEVVRYACVCNVRALCECEHL